MIIASGESNGKADGGVLVEKVQPMAGLVVSFAHLIIFEMKLVWQLSTATSDLHLQIGFPRCRFAAGHVMCRFKIVGFAPMFPRRQIEHLPFAGLGLQILHDSSTLKR